MGAQSRFRRVAWVNVLGNAAKIGVEGSVGLLFGSVALLADAAHSLADLVASVIVLGWGDRGYEDPDVNHPHGHARFEPFTALGVGVAIILMGVILLYESAQGVIHGRELVFNYAMLLALGFAIMSMAAIYHYTSAVNAELQSTALRALAIDCRNDVLTSMAALIGIIGVFFGYGLFDPIAGGVVSLIVITQGVAIGRENVTLLLGSAPPEGKRAELRVLLLEHPEVAGVHDFVVFYEGTDIEVEAHVEVDGSMSLHRAHAIESELMRRLREQDGVGDVHVHLDPSGIGEWKDATDD